MKALRLLIMVLTISALSLVVTSCGFNLKGQYYLAESLRTVYLSSAEQFSPLKETLKVRLQKNDVIVLKDFSEGIAEIRLEPESFQRRTLSLFPNGQVAEYELIYIAKYSVHRPTQDPQNYTVELSREFRDDPNNALAKERERELILSELRIIASDRILAQLNRLR
jgi:LPS-assembly lipoprotein